MAEFVAFKCRVCSSPDMRPVLARETMFGTGEQFEYFECDHCGTLQIAKFPVDMSIYYPPDYYSFRAVNEPRLRRFAKRALLQFILRFPRTPAATYCMKRAPWLLQVPGLRPNSSILDVGCGKGHFLHDLREWGFRNLWGADPYVSEETNLPGLHILKTGIADLRDRFHLIMMHHSLEHVEDPLDHVAQAAERLSPGGSLLIRIPLKGGPIWERYGTDWAQLDAPRHFTLFTKDAFLGAADRLGLRLGHLSFDAEGFSIRWSEAIRLGKNGDAESFSAEENARFDQEIEELNRAGASDQACFVLQKV